MSSGHEASRRRYTVVSFHAHPDDEALLTAGTLAKAAAAGHRVVLVVATDGELGLAPAAFGGPEDLRSRRMAELETSARALGVARVERLGYRDSGMDGATSEPEAFVNVDVETAARRLADVLTSESADMLTVYDEDGGYGHPDHRQVYRVGVRAARQAGTSVVLEATVDRDVFRWALLIARAVSRVVPRWHLYIPENTFTPRSRLTHRIDVRAHAGAKRAAMEAHVSQATATGGNPRTLGLFLRLPKWVFRRALGYEWFTEQGCRTGPPLSGDIFETLDRTRRDRR